MIRKKRDPYWLAQFRKTHGWGRNGWALTSRDCISQNEPKTAVQVTHPHSSSLLGSGLKWWWWDSIFPPHCPFSFPLGCLHSQTDVPPLSGEKEKSPPFSKERGSEISIFERLQVWKYFYSWVTIWLVTEFLVRNTFALAFWRNVLSSSFQHGCCDVWWCFSNICLSGKFPGFEILWYHLVWTFLTYWAG